jgi:hypothetical protein
MSLSGYSARPCPSSKLRACAPGQLAVLAAAAAATAGRQREGLQWLCPAGCAVGGRGGGPAGLRQHQVLMVRWRRRIQPEHHSTPSPPQTRARTSPRGLVPQLAQGLGPGTKHVPALAAGGRFACSFLTCGDPTEQPRTALARPSRLERALQGPGDLNLSPGRMGRLTPG